MMRKMSLAALLLAMAVGAGAEEKPSSLMGWLKNLREGLRESAVAGRRQKGKVTAVAAVRGAPQGDENANPDAPSLSNPAKSRKQRQSLKEREALSKAIAPAEEGKFDEALSALEAFEKQYPKSDYLSAAQEAKLKIAEAKAAPAEEPKKEEAKAEVKPEAKPEAAASEAKP